VRTVVMCTLVDVPCFGFLQYPLSNYSKDHPDNTAWWALSHVFGDSQMSCAARRTARWLSESTGVRARGICCSCVSFRLRSPPFCLHDVGCYACHTFVTSNPCTCTSSPTSWRSSSCLFRSRAAATVVSCRSCSISTLHSLARANFRCQSSLCATGLVLLVSIGRCFPPSTSHCCCIAPLVTYACVFLCCGGCSELQPERWLRPRVAKLRDCH